MAKARQSRERLIVVEVFVNALMRQSLVLLLVSLHLRNEVDEVFRLAEELKFFCIDQVIQLVLDLDDQLNRVQAVEAVVRKAAIQSQRGLLGGAEVALHHRKHVLLNLVGRFESQGAVLTDLIFPHRDLVSRFVFGGDEVGRVVDVQLVVEGTEVAADYIL